MSIDSRSFGGNQVARQRKLIEDLARGRIGTVHWQRRLFDESARVCLAPFPSDAGRRPPDVLDSATANGRRQDGGRDTSFAHRAGIVLHTDAKSTAEV